MARPAGYWKKIASIIIIFDWLLLGSFIWLCEYNTQRIIPIWITIVIVCSWSTLLHLWQAIYGDKI